MNLEDFLDGNRIPLDSRISSKCSICQNENLAEEVLKYAEGYESGEIHHKLNYMWQNYFGPVHKIGSPTTLRNHIRMHLGINI